MGLFDIGQGFKQSEKVPERTIKKLEDTLPQQLLEAIKAETPVKTGKLKASHRVKFTRPRGKLVIRVSAGGKRQGVIYHQIVNSRNPWMNKAVDKNLDDWERTVNRAGDEAV